MANVYYAYNTTDLYLSNSSLANDATYGTALGYKCGTYSSSSNSSSTGYNKSTCTKITILNLILPNSCEAYFYSFKLVTEIVGLDKIDISKVTDMNSMFRWCNALTQLNVSSFNTLNVTDMKYMFDNCKSLTQLDLSNFDTSNVIEMREMFYGCNALTSLDLSNFNTSNVTNMSDMFYNCSSLTQLDLSNFDTSKVTDMSYMFIRCNSLTQLDLSNFDTSNVINMNYMFYGCTNLTTIYSNNFDISKVINSPNMFTDCTKLVGAVPYDSTKVEASMANYLTGYFTHVHNYELTSQTEATCTQSGSATYTCVDNDDSYTEITPLLGHNIVDGVCTRCGFKVLSVKKQLKDQEEKKVYPKTVAEAITDDNGNLFMSLILRLTAGEGIEINNNEISVTYGFADRIKY